MQYDNKSMFPINVDQFYSLWPVVDVVGGFVVVWQPKTYIRHGRKMTIDMKGTKPTNDEVSNVCVCVFVID